MLKETLKSKIKQAIMVFVALAFGFFSGHFTVTQNINPQPIIKKEISPEISLVQIQKIVDDKLFLKFQVR